MKILLLSVVLVGGFVHQSIAQYQFNLMEDSGTLVGIMGGSGAGKSTCLNVLNGNYLPTYGKITLNGIDIHREKDQIQGVLGYVAQDDLLIEELTVFENLYYNARLCFSGMTNEEVAQRVHQTLHSVGLFECKDLRVGSVLDKTISGGQRKYATHKNTSNTSATQTWNWTWQAPAVSEGPVTFYVATNKANNNNNDNGDVIYLSQHVFLNDDASVEDVAVDNHHFSVGYTPEKEEVVISFSTLSIEPTSFNLVDLQGKSVWSKKLENSTVGQNKQWVSVPKYLPNGMYVVHFFIGNKSFSAPISVQH